MDVESVGNAWAREMAIDRDQEHVDRAEARELMDRQLAAIGYRHAQLRQEVQRYPLREGSDHLRDVPISEDGHLPPRLRAAMNAALEEDARLSVPGPGSVRQVVDGRRLIGTADEWELHRAAIDITLARLQAPARLPRVRRQQAAVDLLLGPDRTQERRPDPSGWGRL